MKVCIPTVTGEGIDAVIGEHFGRVPFYTIVNLETDEIKIVPNTSLHMGGKGDPPEIMKKEGVSVMLCHELGRRAIEMFEDFGIDVYIGAEGTVKDAIESFKKSLLYKATRDSACRRHVFHGENKK